MIRRWTCAVLTGLAVCLTARLHAQDADTRPLEDAVRVEPGASCLQADVLVDHIASWLGTDFIESSLTIDVRGSPHFARQVRFEVLRGSESLAERRFEPGPARCDNLHAALGLAIALAIKASLLDTIIPEAAGGGARIVRPWALGLEALVGYEMLPGFNLGGSLRLSRALSRDVSLRAAVLGAFGPHGSIDVGYVESWFAAGEIDVCPALIGWRTGNIFACVGVAAGMVQAHGEDFRTVDEGQAWFVALANTAEARFDFDAAWSFKVALGLVVPLARTRFVILRPESDSEIDSRDLAAVGGFFALGPTYRF